MARAMFPTLLVGVLLFSLVSSVPSRVFKREAEREQEDPEQVDVPEEVPNGDRNNEGSDDKDEGYPYQPYEPPSGFPSIFRPRPSLHNFDFFNDDGFAMDFAIPMRGFRHFFKEVEDAMHEIFNKVSNDTDDLPENYNETNTEVVEINGQKYKVKTTVVKKGDNDSSMYVRVVTMEPTDRKRREAKQIEVPFDQKRRRRSIYQDSELESEEKSRKKRNFDEIEKSSESEETDPESESDDDDEM